jgi:hypothetical protein
MFEQRPVRRNRGENAPIDDAIHIGELASSFMKESELGRARPLWRRLASEVERRCAMWGKGKIWDIRQASSPERCQNMERFLLIVSK